MPLKDRKKHLAYMKEYYRKHREESMMSANNWIKNNREKHRAYEKKWRDRVRKRFLLMYGGRCNCCGENIEEFLTLDHVGGGGSEHRKKFSSSRGVYLQATKEYKPDLYRILCYNCNMALGHRGYCPHQTGP